ncbi:MAG: nucleotidyl transferase AbiEii/AbiGii toxin family protein [Solirubrobacteraceae bacterium]
MIPRPYITEWSAQAPWPSESQIEQDLILSRLIIEIASDELLANELAFRGGTCLHKLHLPRAARYSEDLDYTRTSAEPKIGDCLTALRRIAANIGLQERRRKFPSRDSDMACIWFRTSSQADDDSQISIKIEINVRETTPYQPHALLPHQVESRWWSGSTDVRTFRIEEILATKLRALYARRKGRDLYDLWLALTGLTLDDQLIVDGLAYYMDSDLYSYRQLHANLADKLANTEFLDDIHDLARNLHGYEHRAAAELLMQRLGIRLRNAPLETPTLHFPGRA